MACSMIWTSSSKGISRSLSMSRSTLRSMSTEGLHYSGLIAGEVLSHSRASTLPEPMPIHVRAVGSVERQVGLHQGVGRDRGLHAGAAVPELHHAFGCSLADDDDDRYADQFRVAELHA